MTGVGNHEFDEGLNELLRMQNGGCHPVDGCQDGDGFAGAIFQYLAANVFSRPRTRRSLPPYEIKKIDNAKIAFIGLTLEGTPEIVTPSGVAGLEFQDEIQTINALVNRAPKREGRARVRRAPPPGRHPERARSRTARSPTINGVRQPERRRSSPIVAAVSIRRSTSSSSAHTHQPYNCRIAGKLVTSASSFGRLITDIDLVIDHQTKDVKSSTAQNRIVTQDVAKDPAVTAIVDKYEALAAPLANRVVGRITADIRSAATPRRHERRRRAAARRRDRGRAARRRRSRPTSVAR